MKSYYGVTSSTDHLAHYGVKGMKWGVRKAIALGNEKALDRHYRKAAKKLKKLQDIGLHSKKYAAKSAAYGAAAAGTGTLAITGVKGAKVALDAANKAGETLDSIASKLPEGKKKRIISGTGKVLKTIGKPLSNAGTALNNWAYVDGNKIDRRMILSQSKYTKTLPSGTKMEGVRNVNMPFTNNELFKIGSGVATAGLIAKYAQNTYRAVNSKKYRDKAVNWKNAMDDTFRGTKYEGSYIVPKRKYGIRRKYR